MKYKRLLAPAIVVPEQEDGRPFWPAQALPEFSVVAVMSKKIKPSPITGNADEIYIRWKDAAGRESMGWLAKNTPMDTTVKKKVLSRGIGDLRVTGWDVLRNRAATHPGWSAKKWICTFVETNMPLIHAVIQELGGKVPKNNDPALAVQRSIKLITGKEISVKEAEKIKDKARAGEPKVSKSTSKTTSTKGAKMTKTAKKSKTSTSKKSTKKAARSAGRTSQYAGLRIVRLQKENPRREGSAGYESWNVIKKGMTYEEFVKAGGNPGNLRKEVELGRIKMKKA